MLHVLHLASMLHILHLASCICLQPDDSRQQLTEAVGVAAAGNSAVAPLQEQEQCSVSSHRPPHHHGDTMTSHTSVHHL